MMADKWDDVAAELALHWRWEHKVVSLGQVKTIAQDLREADRAGYAAGHAEGKVEGWLLGRKEGLEAGEAKGRKSERLFVVSYVEDVLATHFFDEINPAIHLALITHVRALIENPLQTPELTEEAE